MEYARPLDKIFILEENIMNGGLGESIIQILSDHNICKEVKLINLGDQFIEQGATSILRENLGLSPERIAATILKNG